MIQKPIERWLHREAPSHAVTLHLVYGGMSESDIASWTREKFDAELLGDFAASIVDAAEDHAQGAGRSGRYFLKWRDADGQTVIAMMWRAGEGLDMNLDGTVESQLAQLQRHLEANAKMHSQGMATLLDHYERALSDSQKRIASLEQVRDAYEQEKLIQVAEAGTPPKPEENQLDKLIKTIDGMERVSGSLKKAGLLGNGETPTKKAKADPS
jgi:hypothetical protein